MQLQVLNIKSASLPLMVLHRRLRSPLLANVRKFDYSSFLVVCCYAKLPTEIWIRGVTSLSHFDLIIFFVRLEREVNGCIFFVG